MATEAPFSEPGLPYDSEVDETSVATSLARLQEMHVALRNLRDTIPRFMESVLVESIPPEQLHWQFTHAATGAASEIKSFAQTMEDDRSRDAMENAKKSKANNTEDITGWLVVEHEDWLDTRHDGASEDVDIVGEVSDTRVLAADSTSGDYQAILGRFKESHPGIEVSLEDTSNTVKVYLPPPAHIHFEIQPSIKGEGDYKLHSKEKTKLHNAILEAISTRSKPKALDTLLEMLASYVDIKSRPCVKCSRVLDRNAQFPVGRSKTRIRQANGQYLDHWEAFHTACK